MWFLLPVDLHAYPVVSWIYTIPYFFLCAFVFILSKKTNIYNAYEKSFNRKAYLLLFAVLTVFFGSRWYLFSDNLAYAQEYLYITPTFKWNYIEIHSWWWDKGYLIFAMLCKMITPDFNFFVFVNTLIDFILFYYVVKKHSLNIPFTIILFLGFYGIIMECNMMRNMKAILLFLISIRYIENRNLLKFLLCNIIGFSMHASALFFFPMYWLLNKKINKRALVALAMIFLFIYIANIDIVNDLIKTIIFKLKLYDFHSIDKVATYYDNSETQKLSLGTIERIITLGLAMYAYLKQKVVDKQFLIFFNSYILFFIAYSVFGFNEVFRDRFTTLFYYSYWFLYPYLAIFYKGKIKHFSLFVMIYAMLRIFMLTSNCAAYYETVFFHNSSISERAMFNAKTMGVW